MLPLPFVGFIVGRRCADDGDAAVADKKENSDGTKNRCVVT